MVLHGIDVFCLVRVHGVGGESNATLVAFESIGRTGAWTTNSRKELAYK